MILRSLLDIAADGNRLSPTARVHHARSLGSERIALRKLAIGATFLERWPVHEAAGMTPWTAQHYDSVAPATFVLRDVIVHSSAGIIQLDNSVIADGLAHTQPTRHGYEAYADGIKLSPRRLTRLRGTHVSLLAGGMGSYFHAFADGPARLSMLPNHLLEEADGVLWTAGAVAQDETRYLLNLAPKLLPRIVEDGDALAIERLVLPLSVHGVAHFHPCVREIFARMSESVADSGAFPKRFYVDRRGSPLRRLVNESELAEALDAQGFMPIRLETLSVAAQIRLFRGAEAIVAPHGAGLTNLGFCQPGCLVLELQMDTYVHWLFRHLASLSGLDYDCVVGRRIGSGDGVSEHRSAWQVSVQHVVAAIAEMMGRKEVLPLS